MSPFRFLRRLTFSIYYSLWVKRRITTVRQFDLLGFNLVVPPGVFHPSLFFSSAILGRYIDSLSLDGLRVLDMGTGSGILALCAARRGAFVEALEISPVAVDCARGNVVRNGLDGRINVRHSDLFGSLVPGLRFDFIFWNPPYYSGRPESDADRAWKSGEGHSVVRRFLQQAAGCLSPGGSVVLIFSSDFSASELASLLAAFSVQKAQSVRRLFETFTIYRLSL